MTLFELFLAGVIIFPIVQSETNVCENPIVCLTENTFSFCFLVNGTEEVLVGKLFVWFTGIMHSRSSTSFLHVKRKVVNIPLHLVESTMNWYYRHVHLESHLTLLTKHASLIIILVMLQLQYPQHKPMLFFLHVQVPEDIQLP
ncbi:hypothetical protein NQ317_011122 [Molorchus minor]|uniref:Uncharacterized protein n=1 Tax=Molorchus minor TaxID=1323400 RepID=A0ABQ9K0V0_9CUCU|nr:hypothetical protein NQ317_011122 [Molorchus minor]